MKMNKNAARGYAVLALLFLLFTIIAFAVPFAKTATFWIGYIFGAVALALQLYTLRSVTNGDAKSRFYGFPIAKVGVVYLVVQGILSILEMALSAIIAPWTGLVLNTVVLITAVIGTITVETTRDEIIAQDHRQRSDTANMRRLQNMTEGLSRQSDNESVCRELEKLTEAIKYSDPVSSDGTMALEENMLVEMDQMKMALHDGDIGKVKELCRKLMALLEERNRVCVSGK